MSFGESLEKIRKEKGISRKDFAEQLEIPYTTLRNYEKDQREPGHKMLIKMATLLSVSVDKLVGHQALKTTQSQLTAIEQSYIQKFHTLDTYGQNAVIGILENEYNRCIEQTKAKENPSIATDTLPDTDKVIHFSIPSYSMPLSAGTGEEAGQEYPENYELVKKPPRGTSFIARVSGDSMEPTFRNGDLVFVHSAEEIPVGKIGAFFMDGQQWVKELGDGVLISHNPEYTKRPITSDIRCQGLVLGVCDESYFE